MIITPEYLLEHPLEVFVFGDNIARLGAGGAAKLRYLPNTYGFITKKFPNNYDGSFFKPDEYKDFFTNEIVKLRVEIITNPHRTYLISKLGAGLANKYKIWEKVIEPMLKESLDDLKNVRFLF
jgi:hypothetical protein